jgi:aldose 1-epimerase
MAADRGPSMSFRTFALVAALLLATQSIFAANITAKDWGTTSKGEKVQLFTLKTGVRHGLVVEISNFGGVVVRLMAPDREGVLRDVVLGYDSLPEYEKGGVYSALIGPYANRLSQSFKLNGQTITQPAPALRGSGRGGLILHSGAIGFQKRVWDAAMHDGREPSLELTIKDADGTGGLPGNVTVTVTYTVRRNNTLVIDYRGITDKPTVLNLTNHFYFDLKGEGPGPVDNEIVTLYAHRYTADFFTDEVSRVDGTAFDFTKPARLGERFAMLQGAPGFDTNMVIDGVAGQLRPAARIDDPDSGIVMVVSTTQPAFQFYTDNVANTVNGKKGHVYGNHNAISIETEHYPDAPSHPNFPSAEVTPDKPLHEITEYRFSSK